MSLQIAVVNGAGGQSVTGMREGVIVKAIGVVLAAVLVSMATGEATGYALFYLQERGEFFVGPGDPVYEGMIVGEHPKDRDIPVNPTKAKHMTNIRAAGKDDAARVRPPRKMSLEVCLEYIQDDELVEICPKSIRIRKRLLKEADRRRAARQGK